MNKAAKIMEKARRETLRADHVRRNAWQFGTPSQRIARALRDAAQCRRAKAYRDARKAIMDARLAQRDAAEAWAAILRRADVACSEFSLSICGAKLRACLSLMASKADEKNWRLRLDPCEAGGVLVTMTNGHVFVRLRDRDGWCKAPVAFVPTLELARALKPERYQRTRLIVSGGRFFAERGRDDAPIATSFVGLGALTQIDRAVKQCPPDPRILRAPMPRGWDRQDKAATITITPTGANSGYIAALAGIPAVLGDSRGMEVRGNESPTGPLSILWDGVDGFGLLMPMRCHCSFPSWAR